MNAIVLVSIWQFIQFFMFIFLFYQGRGILLSEDDTCYEGEFTADMLLSGKVSNKQEYFIYA